MRIPVEVRHKKKADFKGWSLATHMNPKATNDPKNPIIMVPQFEIYWEQSRTVAFHTADDFEWVSIPGYTDEEGVSNAHESEDEDEDEDEDEYENDEELTPFPNGNSLGE